MFLWSSQVVSKTNQLPSFTGKKRNTETVPFPLGSQGVSWGATHREANAKCIIPWTLMNGWLKRILKELTTTLNFLSHMHLRAMPSQCSNQATHNKKLRIIKCCDLSITSYFPLSAIIVPLTSICKRLHIALYQKELQQLSRNSVKVTWS